jgi:Zn-finger nucleic acid-binding protein
MAEARTVRCPNCGAAVAADALHCGYCRAPVATVRCANCYHMNVPENVHCSGCGRDLGLEPAGDPDYVKCPACGVDLEVFHGGPGKLRDCGQCGGQFVQHALMRELVERREILGLAAPRRQRKSNPLADPVRYVKCPECRELMLRKNFGGASGVIVDVCQKHGVWFDRGELPRVLSFVEAGGLVLARRREEEEAKRRVSDERVTAILSPAPAGGGVSEETLAFESATWLVDLAGEIVKWAKSALSNR